LTKWYEKNEEEIDFEKHQQSEHSGKSTKMYSCDRHYEIIDELKINNKRLVYLERQEAITEQKTDNMLQQLTKIEKGITAVFFILLTFFVWFVQTNGGM